MRACRHEKVNQEKSSPLLAWLRRLRKGPRSESSMVRGAVGTVRSGGTHLLDRSKDSLRLTTNSNFNPNSQF